MTNQTLYGDMEDVIHKLTMDGLRDHIARTLGPSPFDFRGIPFLSREKANEIADMIVEEMEKHPEKSQAILEAAYKPGDE